MPGRLSAAAELAASPIIGTVILVAITVVLAATVFALTTRLGGKGDTPEFAAVDLQDAPMALTGATDDDLVVLQHRGGEGLLFVSEYTWKVGGQTVAIHVHDGTSCTATEAVSWEVGQKVCLAEDGVDIPGGFVQVVVIHVSTKTIVFDEEVDVQ